MKAVGLLCAFMLTLGKKKLTKIKTKSNKKQSSTQKTPQSKQHQSGAYIKDKKDFNDLWFIRRYGISDSNWDQSRSQEQLTLMKLARRCGSGMCCLVLTCVLWNHVFITSGFCGASVSEWSLGTKLLCHFCHEPNPRLILLQAFSLI